MANIYKVLKNMIRQLNYTPKLCKALKRWSIYADLLYKRGGS